MDAVDFPNVSHLIAFLLLVIPCVFDRVYGLGLVRSLLSSVARMSGQLFLMCLFEWNNAPVNILWLPL